MNEFRNNYLDFDIKLENVKMPMFGQVLTLEQFVVIDTFDFWQTDKIYNHKEEALDYIDNLLNCKTKQECNFYRWCAKYGLREGSIVQFEDGKQGAILGKEFAEGCLKYNPIKKDGTVSKLKRNLYGNIDYKVVKY